MSLKEILTPKDTEELKPGLFIQKQVHKNKVSYNQIRPLVWKGEWKLNNQIGWRTLINIIIIVFLAWTYFEETSFSRELQENPCDILPNITQYCFERQALLNPVTHEEFNTLTLQDYP